MTDSKKHITATEYGRANLPWVVFKDDKRIEYLYDAADQRIGKHIGDDRAATLSEEYYIRAGGLELAVYDYMQDGITWYLHGTEREAKATAPAPADFIDDSRTAQPGPPTLRWSFYVSDHLGNTRMVFSASCESHAVVYNYEFVADYTPYGRILRSSGHEKYQTTQHERDAETDLDYRGARFYDSDAARFLSLDPLAAKYLALGAYVYVAGNPVRFVDPDGREIRVFYGDEEKKQYAIVNYDQSGKIYLKLANGEDYGGDDEYLNNVILALNTLSESGTGMDAISELAHATDFILKIRRGDGNGGVFSFGISDDDYTGQIPGNPFAGVHDHKSGNKQNPAMVLFHEMDHALGAYQKYKETLINDPTSTPRKAFLEMDRSPDIDFDNAEEKRVILGNEAKVCQQLKIKYPHHGFNEFTSHHGNWFQTNGPVSIKKPTK